MISSLYLHVPFCERKCEYCDFPSLAGALDQQHAYVTTLRRELRALGPLAGAAALETVFVGGGTPSLVDPELLHEVMDEVRSAFRLAPSPEVTLEANPSSTSKERARAWLDAGFTRVSIGVQSLEPDILAFLGRVHDPERALMALREVRQAGFENVNCDLIYAVPGLDDARWVATLERVIDASPDHISAYELTVEQGTPLHVAVSRGRVRPVDEETALRQHRAAIEILHGAGYSQYEVSNFARAGRECRHNLVYWRNGFYLAAGMGAHGHVPADRAAALGIAEPFGGAVALRYWHSRRLADYVNPSPGEGLPLAGHEFVGAPQREAERLMLGLRLSEGAPLDDPRLTDTAATLADRGLLQVSAGRARVTARGQEVLNEVALQLSEQILDPCYP